MEKTNLVGAWTAVLFFVSAILVFIVRLVGKPQYGKWLGVIDLLLILPAVFLLITAIKEQRGTLYFIQIGFVLAWLLLELLLDYVLQIDFRHTQWMVISYVVLFFGAGGGLVGIASHAGKPWTITTGILFIIMAILAFVQRKITGL